MSQDLSEVGTGVNLFKAGEVRGVARWFNDTSDVLSIDDDDLDETKLSCQIDLVRRPSRGRRVWSGRGARRRSTCAE